MDQRGIFQNFPDTPGSAVSQRETGGTGNGVSILQLAGGLRQSGMTSYRRPVGTVMKISATDNRRPL